jgi:hypothetical protein
LDPRRPNWRLASMAKLHYTTLHYITWFNDLDDLGGKPYLCIFMYHNSTINPSSIPTSRDEPS